MVRSIQPGSTEDRRGEQHPVNLLASDGPANQVKGALLPDQWQPDPAWGRCRYAQQFVEVAAKYTLPITTSEKEALAEALAEC